VGRRPAGLAVAPPAYTPAQASYFDALTKAQQTTVVDTVKADLGARRRSACGSPRSGPSRSVT
jgi:hypothetical protein